VRSIFFGEKPQKDAASIRARAANFNIECSLIDIQTSNEEMLNDDYRILKYENIKTIK